MATTWEYKVAYVDMQGRISVEGEETKLGEGQRKSTFARQFLDSLGRQGWELVGIHHLRFAETGYYIFKRPA